MEVMDTCAQTINLPSTTASISRVEQLIDAICEDYHINEDYYGNMLIAVTEAVNNAIQHGNQRDSNKQFMVSVEHKDDHHLCFKVEDQGIGFDYNNLPDPTDPDNIEKPHGRGVFLMRNLADEVNFHDNGRIVELSFTLN